MNKNKEFLDKLHALLVEYNACISWTCGEGSDTCGIYDSCLIITMNHDTIYTASDDYIDGIK